MATAAAPPERLARLVLVTRDGAILGSSAPLPVATPWWQDIAPVVRAAREQLGLDVTILRLLGAERDGPPGGIVTYLAEVAGPADVAPWAGQLDEHPLRHPYARPGGPAADLAWASTALAGHGLEPAGPPEQIRTWNLSSLWRLPLAGGASAWLKAVPRFFAHEGALLEALDGAAVPRLLARDGHRILLAEVAGEDLYDAALPQLLDMVELLVALQHRFLGRDAELLALGLPDWRGAALGTAVAAVLDRHRSALDAAAAATLDGFVAGLPARFAELAGCGIPDTLVHGDFHSGNVRGEGTQLTLLDWGDSGLGHPLLDQAAFLEWVPAAAIEPLRAHWQAQWRRLLPHADPGRAERLLRPLAAARQAVIYQNFLDHIEPSEHPYHRDDPLNWLQRTAGLLAAE